MFSDLVGFLARLTVGLAVAVGLLQLFFMCAGCATVGTLQRPDLRLKPMCAVRQAVVLAEDAPEDLALATQLSVMEWNKAAGQHVFVFLGYGWFSSEEEPDLPMIMVRSRPGEEAAHPDQRATTVQLQRKGCSRGARVTVFDHGDMHARTWEYQVKHELGHVLGLRHKQFGVMRYQMPDWLMDYYLTGGKIMPEDVEDLERLYGGQE